MARLLLVGANHEMLALALDLGHEVAAVADPALGGDTWRDRPLYRSDETALQAGGFDGAVIAIDAPEARKRAQGFYRDAGTPVFDLIGGRLGYNARHGPGLVIQHFANLSVDCEVGEGVRLNTGANVMHDARVGDFTTFAPNAVILGRVTIGALSYVGANATVLPDITIGSGCTIGAGAVVTRDVADGDTVAGNPAR